MPSGPGGVVHAAINIYAGDSGMTVNDLAVVIPKACRRPSRPRSGGWQRTQQLQIRQQQRQLGGRTNDVGVGEWVHQQEEGSLSPFGSTLAAAANAADIGVPGGEEVSANNAIEEEYREPLHLPGLGVIRWRSGRLQTTMLTGRL